MIKNKCFIRIFASYTLISLLSQIVCPSVAFALTSGPESPEFNSFEPVATSDMVNIYSGDLAYNLPVLSIPGPDGGGYAMSLSYHSGVTPEEEASWVGYGWTLNPGALNRQKNGLPDDYNGAEVIQYNKVRPNWTTTAVSDISVEIRSSDEKKDEAEDDKGETKTEETTETPPSDTGTETSETGASGTAPLGTDIFQGVPTEVPDVSDLTSKISLSASKSVRVNNYRGFYSTIGIGAGFAGGINLQMSTGKSGRTTFGFQINPMAILEKRKKKKMAAANEKKKKAEDKDLDKIESRGYIKRHSMNALATNTTFTSSMLTGFGVPISPSAFAAKSFSTSLSFQPNFIRGLGIELGGSAKVNVHLTPANQKMAAYGYFYNKAVEDYSDDSYRVDFDAKGKTGNSGGYYSNLMTDFTLEKFSGFDKQDKYLGLPFANPDEFNSTGETNVGGFRKWYNNPGHFYPSASKSKMYSGALGLEIGAFIDHVTVGFDIGLARQTTIVENWGDGNLSSGVYLSNGILAREVGLKTVERTEEVLDGVTHQSISVGGLKEIDPYYDADVSTVQSAEDRRNSNQHNYAEYIYVHYGDLLNEYNLPAHLANVAANNIFGKVYYRIKTTYLRKDELGQFLVLKDGSGTPAPDDTKIYILDHPFDLSLEFQEEDDGFWRFNHDKAGEVLYGDLEDYGTAKGANVDGSGQISLGWKKAKPEVSTLGIKPLLDEPNRSSTIKSHTWADLNNTAEIIPFELSPSINDDHVDDENENDEIRKEPEGGCPDCLAEFEVIGQNGERTVYGLPVYTRNEKNLSVYVDEDGYDIEDNYMAYKQEPSSGTNKTGLPINDRIFDNKYVTGQKMDQAYSVTHLMTQLTDINYIDITGNGPTDDDFGGWTKFDYRKWIAGEVEEGDDALTSDDNWYRYRFPYNGLFYNKGDMSDPKDDVGTVSDGEKEIFYMKGVETKTHYAFFITNKSKFEDYEELDFVKDVIDGDNKEAIELEKYLTGSGELRDDALGALKLDNNGNEDPAVYKDNSVKMDDNKQELEYLEKIVLVAKNQAHLPLSVTRFEYDYSLCPGLPNARGEGGKLTLKRVWFENQGIVRNKIAPYVFNYNYPSTLGTFFDARTRANYDEKLSTLSASVDGINENPSYDPKSLDSWSYYRSEGEKLAGDMFDWVNQIPEEAYDPAAWNLKQITLPSGGEILIQYEQKDYKYVQDKEALVMAPLLWETGVDDSYNDGVYAIDLDRVLKQETGESDEQYKVKVEEYRTQLYDYFIGDDKPNEYMYFKFLYGMNAAAGIDNENSNYITGFTPVQDVKVENDGKSIHITTGDHPDWGKDKLSRVDKVVLPKEVCYDFYVNGKDGFFDNEKNIEIDNDEETLSSSEAITFVDDQFGNFIDKLKADGDDDESNIAKLLNNKDENVPKDYRKAARKAMKLSRNTRFRPTKGRTKVCQSVDYGHSYMRIPVYQNKLGGGVRVKRLMAYDKGIESGLSGLYGTEYRYELEDGTSSGVASNEPGSGREENALVTLLRRANAGLLRKVFVGTERKQLEGPLGEGVLPSPSVGHSRVVVENIHKGKTGNGYQVHEFNTCKTHPVEVSSSDIGKENKAKDWLQFSYSLLSISFRKSWVAQGYDIVLNRMSGTPSKMATYEGDYEDFIGKKNPRLVSSSEYEYYEKGEPVNILHYDKYQNEDGTSDRRFRLEQRLPGAEEEVAMYSTETVDRNFDLSVELDIEIAWYPFQFQIYNPTVSLQYNLNQSGMHMNTKVWDFPAILKSTTSYVQGVTTTTENLAYDPYTGKEIVTKVTDGYDNMKTSVNGKFHRGEFYSYNIPAHMIYPEMGLIDESENNTNQLNAMAGSFVSYGADNLDDDGNRVSWFELLEKEMSTPISRQPQSIVSANATLFKKDWFLEENDKSETILAEYYNSSGKTPTSEQQDDVRDKLNRIYYPVTSYVYDGEINSANAIDRTTFNSGQYKNFKMFDWESAEVNGQDDEYPIRTSDEWIRGSQVLAYSPHGYAVQERDVHSINSAVRFGYKGNILPVIVGANAEYENIYFADYENEDEDEPYISTDVSHSGNRSLILSNDPNIKLIKDIDGIRVTPQLTSKGAIIKTWVKSVDESGVSIPITDNQLFVSLDGSPKEHPFKKVSSSGEWTLLECQILDWSEFEGLDNSAISVKIIYDQNALNLVYIDDFRFQPFDAEISCNVYDISSLRLTAQYGDQHFGTYYVYDEHGKLIRIIQETERGNQMIMEQKFNTVRSATRTDE